jgi:hypothetical protein
MNKWATLDTGSFGKLDQIENFRNAGMMNPCRRIPKSRNPKPIPASPDPLALPADFVLDNKIYQTGAFLDAVETTGMLVIHKGQKVFERYWHGYSADTQCSTCSLTKSYTSTLIACALRDGLIGSLEDPVDKYAPELAGSGYAGVALRDVLQMSSGVRWYEDYTDPNSDAVRFGAALSEPGSFDELAATLPRECEPGTYNRYNSVDTHVLGMVLVNVTGMGLSAYLQQQIWNPLGMEDDCFFLVDGRGVEAAAIGMNTSIRDNAKLGMLLCRKGELDGKMFLPEGWFEGCSRPLASHLEPGPRPNSNDPNGYGYQWWIPDNSGAFSAIGVYYQYIWVDPVNDVVIAKSSADRTYGRDNDEMFSKECQHLALFRAISQACAQRA